jgi:DNA-binding GntR family transcriptional regulator
MGPRAVTLQREDEVGKAAETAYAVIRTRILSGDFSRGERLREEELAQLAGVSRTPIREALRRLDAEGLVEFQPNRGASVTVWTAAAGNSHLQSLVRGLTDAALVYRTFRHYTPDRLLASKFHHDEIVTALRAGDRAWATAMVQAHILAARPTIQSLLRG